MKECIKKIIYVEISSYNVSRTATCILYPFLNNIQNRENSVHNLFLVPEPLYLYQFFSVFPFKSILRKKIDLCTKYIYDMIYLTTTSYSITSLSFRQFVYKVCKGVFFSGERVKIFFRQDDDGYVRKKS